MGVALQALLWERHAIMAYMAVNRPKTVYQVLSSKMVDPPQPGCEPPPPGLWEQVLVSHPLHQPGILQQAACHVKIF